MTLLNFCSRIGVTTMSILENTADEKREKQKPLRPAPFKMILGVVAGAALGYGFYLLVGCQTGACILTSNPWLVSGIGAFLGWNLVGSSRG